MTVLKSIAMFCTSFFIWGTAMSILGFIFLMHVPCNWFGSTFEGSCSYIATNWTLTAGLILTTVFAITTCIIYFKHSKA